jgi:hypothetical protein
VSKKEIRRAARDAYPKAKNAPAAKKRGTGGAYGKRTYSAGPRPARNRAIPGRPSFVRALTMGVMAGVLYFVIIQWVIHFKSSTTKSNILIGVFGTLLFTAANYVSGLFRYRRYMSKHKDSSK